MIWWDIPNNTMIFIMDMGSFIGIYMDIQVGSGIPSKNINFNGNHVWKSIGSRVALFLDKPVWRFKICPSKTPRTQNILGKHRAPKPHDGTKIFCKIFWSIGKLKRCTSHYGYLGSLALLAEKLCILDTHIWKEKTSNKQYITCCMHLGSLWGMPQLCLNPHC